MKDSEAVERAQEILTEKGWCQGTSYTGDGRVCVGEALVEALTSTQPSMTTEWASRLINADTVPQFLRIQRRLVPNGYVGFLSLVTLAEWNDKYLKDVSQARDRLTFVAKELRNEGL